LSSYDHNPERFEMSVALTSFLMMVSMQEGRAFNVFAHPATCTIAGRGARGAGGRHFLHPIENGLKHASELKENISGFKT
jgi:hypothetical protein